MVATIAAAFGLFYAYAVWNAVAFLIQQATGMLGLNALGWGVLLFAVAFPIIVFAVALGVGMRRPPGHLAVILLTGLGLVAIFWLNVVAYALAYGSSLVGG
nr:bacitracin resistance protein [Microbacterium ureisolvens]